MGRYVIDVETDDELALRDGAADLSSSARYVRVSRIEDGERVQVERWGDLVVVTR